MINPIQMDRARGFLRDRMESFMTSTAKVTRPHDPTFSITEGFGKSGAGTAGYEGICRINMVSGGSTLMVGEEVYSPQNANISFPWDMDPLPYKDDYIKLLTCPHDVHLVGKVFIILDVASSGELRASRSFAVSMIQDQVPNG